MADPADDSLAARLRRLRGEGEAAVPAREAAARPAPPARRVRRLAARTPSAATPVTPGEAALGLPDGLRAGEGPAGGWMARERAFPAAHRHGDWALAEVDAASREAIALAARDPSLATLDLLRAIYLDIETTGLSGGAGTVPFLVALGTFAGDGSFAVWQGFLRGPEEERAMLAEAARRLRAAEGIVSFFGKSFDRHRLEDKMAIHGIAAPFAGKPHLDLYHPLRRLYGGAFPDGRLATLERELCGLERQGDLAGRFAPEAWFDFLAGRGHRLEQVFQHNLDDVLSLVVLAAHLGRSLVERREDGRLLAGPGRERARGLSRLLGAPATRAAALAWSERALARDPSGDRSWRLFHADLLRGSGRWPDALELYAILAGEAEDEVAARAALELAKLHEHRRGDPSQARAAVQAARRIAERAATGAARSRLLADCARREARLGAERR
ncbi:MAG: ribonuclease H-like domain-containing protein [Planctomycetota bacterium]